MNKSEGHAVPTLSVIDVACRRGERILFRGARFEVRSGRGLWLRGCNGRGKTSLLRLVAGLAAPESGQLLWGDRPLAGCDRYPRQRVYIGHADGLKGDLSAVESLQFLARLHARPHDARAVSEALARLGVRRDALVRTLSQGQRRRVALARLALETAPALWILDEPYDALDADGIGRLDQLLEQHLRRGGSALLTCHQCAGSVLGRIDTFELDRCA